MNYACLSLISLPVCVTMQMKIAQERQRRSTTDSLRREINELSKVQNKMMWERKQVSQVNFSHNSHSLPSTG